MAAHARFVYMMMILKQCAVMLEAAGAGAAKMLVGREAVGNKKSKLGFNGGRT